MASVNGVSSYSYNYYDYSGLSSSSWTDKANSEADQLKESLGISSTSSTNKTTSASSASQSASSVSGFLMGYQTRLEDLEKSASKLQFYQKDNVFSKFDDALAKVAANPEGGTASATKAADDVISAVKDFVKDYNSTISYLKSNTGMGSGISDQLASMQRAMPSEKTLKAVGLTYDSSGQLQFDESVLKNAMDNALNKAAGTEGEWDPEAEWGTEWDQAKDIISGQYGIADRVGAKATYALDSPVNRIVGDSASAVSSTEAEKSTGTKSATASASKSTGMSDSFLQFASFAKSGAYNLTNYYAVSMLNILV